MDMERKIRRLLSESNETQTQFALRFGVSQSTVNRWLNGAEPGGHYRDLINSHYATVFSENSDPRQPIQDEAEVKLFLSRIRGLTDEDIQFLMKNIRSALVANGAEPLQIRPRDQSQSASPHRESEPSQ